jgi:outer membrane immunogenic protein
MNRKFMQRVALASLMLAGAGLSIVGSAGAADLAVAPARAAPFSWTGCYVGGFAGWATANTWTATDLGSGATPLFIPAPAGTGQWSYSENTSFLGGGTVGCNYQPWAGSGFVIGAEGEAGYLSLSASSSEPNQATLISTSKMGTGYGLIAGRLGWAFYERILLYGKAGVAFYDTSAGIINPNGADAVTASGSKSQTPLAVGGGVEYAMSDHWTGKAEYTFLAAGSSYNICGVDAALGQNFCWRQDPSSIHLVKFGLNYKF